MTTRAWSNLLLLMLLVAPGMGLATGPRAEEARYVHAGHYDIVTVLLSDLRLVNCLEGVAVDTDATGGVEVEPPADVSETCFWIEPGETSVAVEIVDATGIRVAARATQWTVGGARLYDSGYFCAGTTVPIVAGAAVALVELQPYWPNDALECGNVGPATMGVVRASFS